jgi:hypothetical protein
VDSAVAAALVSSGAALVIAVVGIVATGVAQARATKKAHKNALDLFDRQEQARRRDAHLETKRDLYSRLPMLVDEYGSAKFLGEVAWENFMAALREGPDEETTGKAAREWRAVVDADKALIHSVEETIEHVHLLAPKSVTDAAVAWVGAAKRRAAAPGDVAKLLVESATAAVEYRRAVRADLGVEEPPA